MLSYLHGFHAGGHADVLKHVVLVAILDSLAAKPKPLRYVETHAGAGAYDLRAPAAQRNREHDGGVGRLWGASDAPPPVARWLELVRKLNGDGTLSRYPGSPWLAQQCLRDTDALHLFELHPAEHATLDRATRHDRRVKVLRENGLAGAVGLVPPPERRGLVFIDPPYERDEEAGLVLDALRKTHRRFATGVYAIWYPVIERRSVERLERSIRGLGIAPLERYELCVTADAGSRGLKGSGMWVVNPPWKLQETMAEALPWLTGKLATGARAAYAID